MKTTIISAIVIAVLLTVGGTNHLVLAQDSKVRFLLVCSNDGCVEHHKDLKGEIFRFVCSNDGCADGLRKKLNVQLASQELQGKQLFMLVCDSFECADDLRKNVKGELFRFVCDDDGCTDLLRRHVKPYQSVLAKDQREKKIMLMTPNKKAKPTKGEEK